MNKTQSFNQKISTQIYFAYYLRSLAAPILLIEFFLIATIVLGKFFFLSFPIWFYVIIALPILIYLFFHFYSLRRKFFSEQELWAYIDVASNASGQYLALNELGQTKLNQENILAFEKKYKKLSVKFPISFLFLYVFSLLLLIAILWYTPNTFVSIKLSNNNLFENEISQLDSLLDAGVFNNEQAKEVKEEIERIHENILKKGINKDNWNAKQEITQFLDHKIKEQNEIQSKILEDLEQIKQSIEKNSEIEKLAKALESLEGISSKNNYEEKSESFKTAKKILEKVAKETINNLAEKMALEQKKLALEAMQQFMKEMQNQQNERVNSLSGDTGKLMKLLNNEKGLQEKLSQLLQEVQTDVAKTYLNIQDDSDSPPQNTELKMNNSVEPSVINNRFEKLNESARYDSKGVVVDKVEADHDKAIIDTERSEARQFQNTNTDMVNTKAVLPNRRGVVQKYFNRSIEKDEK